MPTTLSGRRDMATMLGILDQAANLLLACAASWTSGAQAGECCGSTRRPPDRECWRVDIRQDTSSGASNI